MNALAGSIVDRGSAWRSRFASRSPREPRGRRWPLWMILAAMLGCTTEGAVDESERKRERPPPIGGGRGEPNGGPDCVAEGYPCTWEEVPEAILVRTDRVAKIATALMREVEDLRTVVEVIGSEVDLDELDYGDSALRFRLPGSRAVWIPLPQDRDNPLRGGGPGALSQERLATAPSFVSLAAPAWAQAGASGDKINTDEPGSPKKALILASVFYEFGWETRDVYEKLVASRDYSPRREGQVDFLANLKRDGDNPPPEHRTPRLRPITGRVGLTSFTSWNEYNFVYVATHGYATCPADDYDWETDYPQSVAQRNPQVVAKKCYGALRVRDFPVDSLAAAIRAGWNPGQQQHPSIRGVEFLMDPNALHPGLSPTEARTCLALAATTDPDPQVPGTTKPCLYPWPVGLEVTAEFFRTAYEGGLNDTVVFLAACEALWTDDLAQALAPAGSRDVAIFGFNRAVESPDARLLGLRAVDLLVGPEHPRRGLDNEAVREELEALARANNIPHFDSETSPPQAEAGLVALDPGGPSALPQILDAASNPTHARDVVELIDPKTGEELQDGATVRAERDRIEVVPQIVGVKDEDAPPQHELKVRVVGEPMPGESYVPTRHIEGAVYRHVGDVALGREAENGEVVDLEIRTELPGGGRSRWVYEDIVLVRDECYFRATLRGDVPRGRVEGELATWSQPAQDAARIAGPLLRNLGAFGMEDAVDAEPEEIDVVLERMEQVGVLALKFNEGAEDVNSFDLQLSGSGAGGSELGGSLAVDGLGFVLAGRLELQSQQNGWMTGTFRGKGKGADVRSGVGGGTTTGKLYEVEIDVEFRAGNPTSGAFCEPSEEDG